MKNRLLLIATAIVLVLGVPAIPQIDFNADINSFDILKRGKILASDIYRIDNSGIQFLNQSYSIDDDRLRLNKHFDQSVLTGYGYLIFILYQGNFYTCDYHFYYEPLTRQDEGLWSLGCAKH